MTQQGRISQTIARVLGCCLLLALAVAVQAQETAEELTARGREALGAGRYEEALELFNDAFPQITDRAAQDRLLFYRAVTTQRLAEDAEGDRRQALLKRSAELYDGYLEAHPDSGAATNNLAKIYAALGWNDTAAELFERALATKDNKQGLYLKNYAQFLDDAGDWEEATELYSRMVQEQPLSAALQESMAERFARAGIDQFAGYLWELLEAGYARQAARRALDALTTGDGSANERIELLTVVCAALARIPYSPAGFADLELAQPLAALGSDPDIGRGAADITSVHEVEALDPDRFGWWAHRSRPDEDPARGVWPVDGFRALVRSLGSRYKEAGEPRTAERYYRLAADLQPHDVDPAAIRDLTQLYIEENQLAKVDSLAGEYEERLFEAKGGAYRNSRVRKIFEFHRTLGELYATIGRWGSSGRADSAIFQLEHAQEKSRELEARAVTGLPERYRFTPTMVNMLATGYVAADQSSRSYELRVNEAERFQKQGDTEAVRKVLEPIKAQELPAHLRSRMDRLTVSPATTGAAATTAATATTATTAATATMGTTTTTATTTATVTGRALSRTATADRLRQTSDPVVHIDTSRMSTRKPLAQEDVDRIAAQLQRNLGRGATDAASLDWGDAPGTPRKLAIDGGSGVLVLRLGGDTIELPFEVVLKGNP